VPVNLAGWFPGLGLLASPPWNIVTFVVIMAIAVGAGGALGRRVSPRRRPPVAPPAAPTPPTLLSPPTPPTPPSFPSVPEPSPPVSPPEAATSPPVPSTTTSPDERSAPSSFPSEEAAPAAGTGPAAGEDGDAGEHVARPEDGEEEPAADPRRKAAPAPTGTDGPEADSSSSESQKS
jgi:hypothetical protein